MKIIGLQGEFHFNGMQHVPFKITRIGKKSLTAVATDAGRTFSRDFRLKVFLADYTSGLICVTKP